MLTVTFWLQWRGFVVRPMVGQVLASWACSSFSDMELTVMLMMMIIKTPHPVFGGLNVVIHAKH